MIADQHDQDGPTLASFVRRLGCKRAILIINFFLFCNVVRDVVQAPLAMMALFCFIVTVLGSFAPQAYNELMPKRVILQHHSMHDAEGSILSSRQVCLTVVALPTRKCNVHQQMHCLVTYVNSKLMPMHWHTVT